MLFLVRVVALGVREVRGVLEAVLVWLFAFDVSCLDCFSDSLLCSLESLSFFFLCSSCSLK